MTASRPGAEWVQEVVWRYRDAPMGLAPLDAAGKVPAACIPSTAPGTPTTAAVALAKTQATAAVTVAQLQVAVLTLLNGIQ